jgi:hypothetical protein
MDEGLNNWYEALRRGVQLSGTTQCDTLEILQYPSLAKPQWHEGTVDDSTLPEWLSAVCSTCAECVNRNLTSYLFRNHRWHVQQHKLMKSPQVVCDFCMCRWWLRALRLTDVLPDRIATSDWNDDEKLVTLPFKRDSFSLVQKYLALPEHFLNIVTSYHTRGVKFSAYRQSSLSFPGKSSPILEIPLSAEFLTCCYSGIFTKDPLLSRRLFPDSFAI